MWVSGHCGIEVAGAAEMTDELARDGTNQQKTDDIISKQVD